jgi:outer membrane receptor protein involved in Fe transport
VEISTEWQATDRLYLAASAMFSDPRFTEDIVRLSDVVTAGTPMIWAADRKYYLSLEYVVPEVLGGDLWFRYDYSYEGEKWNTLDNAVANDRDGLVPSWELSNFHAGLDLQDGWAVQVDIRNVWDQLAYNSLENDSNPAFFGDARFDNIRNYSRPRTVGLTVRKRFD